MNFQARIDSSCLRELLEGANGALLLALEDQQRRM